MPAQQPTTHYQQSATHRAKQLDMLESLITDLQATSPLEAISVVFGLAYVILAARENIWCWPAALIGTGTAIFLFWDVSLLMESALNVYYLLMAVFGWWQWRYGGHSHTILVIQSWSARKHGITMILIIVLTLVSGLLLSQHTQASYPFVDSFTTWSAVITTWMVARKVLENWLYWIVIDLISIWLFLQKGLVLYALLFAIYTVIAVLGYRHWRAKFQNV